MNNDLYQKTCDKWGVDAQLTVAIEELSELAKEICKHKRGNGSIDHIAEEVADVEIMCEQLRFIFNISHYVDGWKKYKLDRLQERINDRK